MTTHPPPPPPSLSEIVRLGQLLLDTSPSLMAYWGSDLRCRVVNRAGGAWYGRDPQSLIGVHMAELLGPELFALNRPHIEAALRGEPQRFERRLTGADGSRRDCLLSYTPDLDGDAVAGFMVQVTDLSWQKQAEGSLRASEALLERTGRLANVGGWEVDLLGNTIRWTEQTRRIHEVDASHVPRFDSGVAFYAPEARPLLVGLIEASLRTGEPFDAELPFLTARGRSIWVRVLGEVEFENGEAVRLNGAIQDVTEQRQRRQERQREQEMLVQAQRHALELDALLRERGEMLDVLAHEVRQPLNNASAALQSALPELLRSGEAAAASRLKRAQAVLSQVQASIDNTLAVASLLARSEPAQPEDTDIDTLLAVAVADLPAQERHRVAVQRLTRTRTAAMDMSLMRLALRNLLANGLAYSPPGSTVAVRLADSDAPLALIVDVVDSGPGIDSELVPRLFARGVRGNGVRHPAGHGLGLYIVRRVMDLHGGSVELVANGPAGCALRLTLPQAAEE